MVRERANAARNRLRLLAAAEQRFGERGVGGVTMEEIVAAAGVGKGTLYRRLIDRVGLSVPLLDQRERELQAQILRGPPPLGPGAPAAERLVAFTMAYLALVNRQLDLVLMSETAGRGTRPRRRSARRRGGRAGALNIQAGRSGAGEQGDGQRGHDHRDQGVQHAPGGRPREQRA